MDLDSELRKQMDELKEHLIVLSMIENKSSQRIQDHERRIQEHDDWLRDLNAAMTAVVERHKEIAEWHIRFAEEMAEQKDRIDILVALADDWIRRRDDDKGKGGGNGRQ
ncbi:MAG: hypothetical protein M3Y07_10285 [Acidobacteriota bacterium]|nr:hypothetical protein [Acidobacteriota bacterium]